MTPADVADILRKHRELEALISSHNWWLGVFTAIVALGIFAETIVEFWFSKDKPRLEVMLTVVCSLFVLGGVVGEYIQGSNVAELADELQQIADKDVAQLYKEASDANDRAGTAGKEAGAANERAAKATKTAGQATERAAELAKQTEQLRAQTALKEERLEQGAWLLGNVFLPRRVAFIGGPKGYSGREFDAIKQFAGTRATVIAVPDLESVRLAVDIAGVLQAAQWKLDPPLTILSFDQGYSLIGVHITTDVKPHGPPPPIENAAWQLMLYLDSGYLTDLGLHSSAGIDADVGSEPPIARGLVDWWPIGFVPPTNTVCVFVGRKDFKEELSNKAWFEHLPDGLRKRFLERQIPWIQ